MNRYIKFGGTIKRLIRWQVGLILLLLIMNAAVCIFSRKAGILMFSGLVLYAGISLILYMKIRPPYFDELIADALTYETSEKKMLAQLELPFVIMDHSGRMIWGNDSFCLLTGRDTFDFRNIRSIFPELSDRSLARMAEDTDSEPVLVNFKDSIYRMSINGLELAESLKGFSAIEGEPPEGRYYMACFFDETLFRQTIQKYEDEKLVLALIYIDNYEEALESVEEARRSLLTALIDRKISKYFSDYDGIVRKLEKDKYFLVLSKTSLAKLRESRFDILEEVKTVNIGNSMPITISIGIGLGASSFRQNNEYARIAIEMALGRGGDQAVVKDGTAITYWGGKSLQMEKNTRVKARMKAQALKEFITTKDTVVVMGHKITDVDALGAAIGIYRAAKTLGKEVHIVVNDPTTSIRPLMEAFLDNPEYENEMFVDSSRAKELVDNNTVVVVVDTNKPGYTECQDLLYLTRTVVVLDHHRRGNEIIENAVLSYVEPYASSTCEMVSEILQYFSEELRLRCSEADCLYAGIVIDTNNFTTRTGVRTFEAAAFLRRNGADITRVRKMLRDNIDSYKAKAEAVRTAEIYRDYFAIAQCPSSGLESPTVVGAQAANELLNIAGVKASFVLTSFNDEIYISARAIDEVNVQVMMEELGGGGHLNIAGAQVQVSEEETRTMLKEIIDRFMENGGIKK